MLTNRAGMSIAQAVVEAAGTPTSQAGRIRCSSTTATPPRTSQSMSPWVVESQTVIFPMAIVRREPTFAS